jgi:hypothetical protein
MKHAVLLIALLSLLTMLFGDIYSTEDGGSWTMGTTWEGGLVPSSSDNVIIQGPVEITTGACSNLTVTDRGSLKNVSSMTGTLNSLGQIINMGTIAKNTSGNLNVYAFSHLDNNGVFTPTYLYLTGGAANNLSGSTPMGPSYLTDNNSGTPVFILSDISFENTVIDFNSSTLYLSSNPNTDLSLIGGSLQEANIHCGSTGSLTMDNNAYVTNVYFFETLTLNGTCLLGTNVFFNNVSNLINNGTLCNRTGYSITIYVTQQLVNNGTIMNSPVNGTLAVNFSGQYLYNYGTLSNQSFTLSRSSACYLYHDPAAPPISCPYFYSTSTSGFYQLLSDISFSNTVLNFYNKTVYTTGTESYDISTSGGNISNTRFVGNAASILTLAGTNVNGGLYSESTTFINDTVTLTGTNTFASLNLNGSIQNYSGSTITLTVTGNLVVNSDAQIRNNSGGGTLTIALAGGLYNSGTIVNYAITLNNSGTTDLFHNAPLPIRSLYFTSTGSGGYQLLSDLSFSNCYVNFNSKNICMHNDDGDYGISVAGSNRFLQNAVLNGGAQSYLNLESGAYLLNVSADNLYFFGNVLIKQNVVIDTLINYAVLANYNDSNYILVVNTRLENHETIQNSSGYSLYISLYGDLHNEGVLSNNRINLYGDGVNCISQSGASTAIACTYFNSLKTAGSIQLFSDITFQSCYVILSGNNLVMHDAGGNYSITLSGGYFKQANIDGAQGCYLVFSGGAWIQSVSANYLGFAGTMIAAEGVSIGTLVNNATLYDYYGNYSLNIANSLENYGTIRNSMATYSYVVNLQGSLYNYGTIQNSSIQVSGPATHYLYQGVSAQPISCPSFTVDTESGELQLLSDLAFENCSVNLGGRILRMYQDRSIYNLSLDASSLTSAILPTSGFSTLDLSNDSWLSFVTGQDIILTGTVYIVTGATFEDLVVQGVVQNGADSSSLNCNGNLVNNGIIRNNPLGSVLHLYCFGGLANYGSMSNYAIHVAGQWNIDQYIVMAGDISCSGGFHLESQIGDADWFFNAVQVYNGIQDISVDPGIFGIWQPVNGAVTGRQILISNGGPIIAPVDPIISLAGGEDRLVWEQVANAVYYRVYVSPDPHGNFTLLADHVYDYDLSDTHVWIDIDLNETPRFYKVTALN